MNTIGAVIIGRNEAKNLAACIDSFVVPRSQIVYVDSDSTDESLEIAKSKGVGIVELDPNSGFSAGRARNQGAQYLRKNFPDIRYIQFVDGDCILCEGWLDSATESISDEENVAIVCGYRREKYPESSIFNRLCDIEWLGSPGFVDACGGDFLADSEMFFDAGGFNPEVIAGEEPELCFRLSLAGKNIVRIGKPMTMHDANMHTFRQWWMRAKRSGHAYAQNMHLHMNNERRFKRKDVLSILCFGLLIPVLVLFATFLISPKVLVPAFFFYLVMIYRIFVYARNEKRQPVNHSIVYAMFTILGKIPQSIGVLEFFRRKLLAAKIRIIEYK